jgi:hypothetical protein
VVCALLRLALQKLMDLGRPGKDINEEIITNNARCIRAPVRSGLTAEVPAAYQTLLLPRRRSQCLLDSR